MTILGSDDRVRNTMTATNYKAVVEIEVVFPDGTAARGSGALVGRNDVLTAGHVLYSAEHGGAATQVFVYPGRDGGAIPFGSANGVKITVDPAWITSLGLNFSHDVGLVTLDRNIGDLAGWYAYLAGGADAQYTGAAIDTAGYPGDKDYGTQWTTTGVVDSSSRFALDFTSGLDVAGGQSGSPIFNSGAIIGVISNGSTTRNQAIRISSDFAPTLAAAIAGDAPEGFWPVSSGDAGNTQATAKQIALPLGAFGTVGFASDPADWFTFTAAKSGRLDINMTGLGSDLDLVLTDSTGVAIAVSRFNGLADEHISFDVVAGRAYSIQIAPKFPGGPLSGYVITGQLTVPDALTSNVPGADVAGTAAADLIVVDGGGQHVTSLAGNDRIEVRAFGTAGVTIDGGVGRDTVALPGLAGVYSKTTVNGVLQFTPLLGAGGVPLGAGVKLTGIESIQFSDKELFVLPKDEANVARLYTAALGRTPDHDGLYVQLDAFEAGAPMHVLAQNFVASAEFKARFPSITDDAFVESMYVNSLGRASDAGGKAFWLNYLAAGHDRADVLVGFATSPEHAVRTGDWLLVG